MGDLTRVRLRHIYPPAGSGDWVQDVELARVPSVGESVLVTDEVLPNGNIRGHIEAVADVVWVPGATDAAAVVVLETLAARWSRVRP